MKISKFFKLRFKWLTWRFFPSPEELSIKSIMEILLYVFIFSICWFFFYYWNVVPVREESIYVDCIKQPRNEANTNIAPVAKIFYYIPMTSTDWEPRIDVPLMKYQQSGSNKYGFYPKPDTIPLGFSVVFAQWETSRRKDTLSDFIVFDNSKDPLHNDSIRKQELCKSPFWRTTSRLGEDYPYHLYFPLNYDNNDSIWRKTEYSDILIKRHLIFERNSFCAIAGNKRDSLERAFYAYVDTLTDRPDTLTPIYYMCHERNALNRFWDNGYDNVNVYKDDTTGAIDVTHITAGNFIRKKEQYSGGSMWFRHTTLPTRKFGRDNTVTRPGWFRLEDISQAYYDIKLESYAIDSITLKFDFIGATEFSKMEPEPDRITMSSIEFSDPTKILDIRYNGLRFHAKFIELENRQYIRLICVTTIMGGIVIIFIGMLFIGIMKFFARERKKTPTKMSHRDSKNNLPK